MTATLGFPLQFVRQFAGSLDRDEVFSTEAALNAYLTSGLRYAGQIVACVETEKAYMLNAAKDAWIELPTDTEAGEKRVYGVSNAVEFDAAILALNELPGGGTIILLDDIDDYGLDTLRSIDNIKIIGAMADGMPPLPKITLTGPGALTGNNISLHKLQIVPFGENEPIIAYPGPYAYVETSNVFYPGGAVPMIELAVPSVVRSRSDTLIRYSGASDAIQFAAVEGSIIIVDGGTVINDGTCTITGADTQNFMNRNDLQNNQSEVEGNTTADALNWLKNQAPGTGDVSGASDVTDGSIALHDGTTGKLLKEGPVFGTGPNNAVQLSGDAKLPAVDGSNLTNLPTPTAATDAELDTGTDQTKYATAKAIKDAKNIPHVVPGANGNVLTSDGTNWTSAAPPAAPTPLTFTEYDNGSNTDKSITIDLNDGNTHKVSIVDVFVPDFTPPDTGTAGRFDVRGVANGAYSIIMPGNVTWMGEQYSTTVEGQNIFTLRHYKDGEDHKYLCMGAGQI